MNNSNHATVPAGAATIQPESLGSSDFCRDYNIKYAYLSGLIIRKQVKGCSEFIIWAI